MESAIIESQGPRPVDSERLARRIEAMRAVVERRKLDLLQRLYEGSRTTRELAVATQSSLQEARALLYALQDEHRVYSTHPTDQELRAKGRPIGAILWHMGRRPKSDSPAKVPKTALKPKAHKTAQDAPRIDAAPTPAPDTGVSHSLDGGPPIASVER